MSFFLIGDILRYLHYIIYVRSYLLTYLLTYLLHRAESFLVSEPVLS